ncbi:MAG: uracil phosphoribosyltransferase [Bacteroidetes bacterium]|nr:uracil phosphoribosyltransferase [Bacteroidota bacterium]
MGKLINLGEAPSLLQTCVQEMRDEQIQQDRLRFRTNMQRLGGLMAYELSKDLPYRTQEVVTPLGELQMPVLEAQPVLATILRAGLPFHDGFLQMFDRADNAFISAYRKPSSGKKFKIEIEYVSSPTLDGRVLILTDPMIATGKSIVRSIEALRRNGEPGRILIAGIIAAEEGIEYIQRHLPQADIWVAALDSELTAKSYIVPGLGDAGDLAYGSKR